MRIFTLIWFGQFVSTIGSYMTYFALTLWVWDTTGSATALALLVFFLQLSRIPITLISGLIVDRFNRKRLMILGDGITALATLTIGALYLMGHLQIWHFYLVAILIGSFGQIQMLAYQTSMTLIVPKQHYTRANSMAAVVHYGSNIIGPALAGMLYPRIGLAGILLIDLVTFTIAIATLLAVPIPQPQPQEKSQSETILSKLTFGFRYIWQRSSLRTLLLLAAIFWFAHDLGSAIYQPMILARTNGSAEILAGTATAAGLGGVAGAVLLSLWGGPKRRIHGMLAGFIGAGICKIGFGLGRSPQVWLPTQFCSSLNFPLLGSSGNALWMEQVVPEKQGRVFAARALVTQVVSAIAALIAGPLADRGVEPAMLPGGSLSQLFSPAFGTGVGAGMSLLYVLCALMMMLVGVNGFFIPQLKTIAASESN
ncbi:MAG: MFS transporter [Cyanobacteria bacterium P01_A01_bin.123]